MNVFVSAVTLPGWKPGYKPDDWSVINSSNRAFVMLRNINSLVSQGTTLLQERNV